MTNFDVVLPTRKCRNTSSLRVLQQRGLIVCFSVTHSSCHNVFSSFGQTLFSYSGIGVTHMNVSISWPSVMHM